MADSPIKAVLQALDALDLDATLAMFADTGTLLRTDGQRAEGIEQVRTSLEQFFSQLRSTSHELSAEWHPEPDVWIGQLTARYVLLDFGQHGPYPRAVILRDSSNGIVELSFYGSHELPLAATEQGYREVYAAGRWMPTL
jgi:hypothetical protein